MLGRLLTYSAVGFIVLGIPRSRLLWFASYDTRAFLLVLPPYQGNICEFALEVFGTATGYKGKIFEFDLEVF